MSLFKIKFGLFFAIEGEGAMVQHPPLSLVTFLDLGLSMVVRLTLHLQPLDASLCPTSCP